MNLRPIKKSEPIFQRRFVTLDRDGTIIKECPYLSDPALVELLPGAAAGLRRLQQLGLGLIIVTNQSAIGRGLFDEARLAEIHRRLAELLAAERITLDGIYYCPHTPEDDCACRKPRSGLLEAAAGDLNFEIKNCFVIGDNVCDLELGRGVGATFILVRTGYGAQVEAKENIKYVVNNLEEAAQVIERLLAVNGSN